MCPARAPSNLEPMYEVASELLPLIRGQGDVRGDAGGLAEHHLPLAGLQNLYGGGVLGFAGARILCRSFDGETVSCSTCLDR